MNTPLLKPNKEKTTMSTIDDIIAEAKKSADTVAAPAVVEGQSSNVTTFQGGGEAAPMSMDVMVASGVSVDQWLKISEAGVGVSKKLFEEIDVELDLNEVQPCMSVKAGNPAKYWKTYDQRNEVKGGSWLEACAEAAQIDPKAKPYRSADIPLRVTEAIIFESKKETLTCAEPGQLLGISLSTTGWKNFEAFYKQMAAAGLKNGILSVRIGVEERNGNGNTWGVATYELLGIVDARNPEFAAPAEVEAEAA